MKRFVLAVAASVALATSCATLATSKDIPVIEEPILESVTYSCVNPETTLVITSPHDVTILDNAVDNLCVYLEHAPVVPSALVCFDRSGNVTTGDDWKECRRIPTPTDHAE